MKVILNHSTPFALAHGGVTNIVNRTKDVLDNAGIEVEYLRWWDDGQKGDILFHFGRPSLSLVTFAKAAGYKVVAEHVMTGLVSRPLWKRRCQKVIINNARKHLPSFISQVFSWDVLQLMDMNFFPSDWDATVAAHMFNVEVDKTTILPYGVNDAFLKIKKQDRGDYLVCTATITPRKRVLQLARACDLARVPLKVVGKAYAQSDEYFDKFQSLVNSSSYVKHVPHVSDQDTLAEIYRGARGFVLISSMETISQSAIEAAACGTPLLLSDLEWAHRGFGNNATYCPVTEDIAKTAGYIQKFYADAENHPVKWIPPSWSEARAHLPEVLERVLKSDNNFRLGLRTV